jgi:hypothetical protein
MTGENAMNALSACLITANHEIFNILWDDQGVRQSFKQDKCLVYDLSVTDSTNALFYATTKLRILADEKMHHKNVRGTYLGMVEIFKTIIGSNNEWDDYINRTSRLREWVTVNFV